MTSLGRTAMGAKSLFPFFARSKSMASAVLDPKSYDEAEIAAIETVPNRVIECSGTVTFSSLGYPTRVSSTPALARYVDVMHEGRAEATFRDFLQGITEEELKLLQIVTKAILENSTTRYGQRKVATGSLLRALVIVRAIRAIYPEKSRLIYEIGHGCGYVGALLLADGYAYASTDIAQAFYVYQNNLLNQLAPGRVTELANGGDLGAISSVKPGHALHIPWWQFYKSRPSAALAVDAVTCNHALAEMHPNSLSYVIKIARLMLTNPDSAFVFEGWGSTVNTPIWAVAKRFSDLGYSIAHNNITGSVFVPEDREVARGCLRLPIAHRTDPVFDVAPYMEAAFVQQFHPSIYITPESPLSKRFTDQTEQWKQRATVTYDDVCAMFRAESGISDLTTEDEYFSQFTDSPY